MEEHTLIQCKLSKDQDYTLTLYQAKLAKMNLKQSKAELLVKMAMIGLLQEDEKLTEYINK